MRVTSLFGTASPPARLMLLALIITAVWCPRAPAQEPALVEGLRFVEQYCVGCRDGLDGEAGLDLARFGTPAELATDRQLLSRADEGKLSERRRGRRDDRVRYFARSFIEQWPITTS